MNIEIEVDGISESYFGDDDYKVKFIIKDNQVTIKTDRSSPKITREDFVKILGLMEQ